MDFFFKWIFKSVRLQEFRKKCSTLQDFTQLIRSGAPTVMFITEANIKKKKKGFQTCTLMLKHLYCAQSEHIPQL